MTSESNKHVCSARCNDAPSNAATGGNARSAAACALCSHSQRSTYAHHSYLCRGILRTGGRDGAAAARHSDAAEHASTGTADAYAAENSDVSYGGMFF